MVERVIVLTCLVFLCIHGEPNAFKRSSLRRYFDLGRSVFLALSAQQAEAEAGRLASSPTVDGKTAKTNTL